MTTDPPASFPPHPPRPKGKVFDVMAPGKAPAAPTSRPVVSGHKPEAQQSQITVSGIGAAAPRGGMLDSHQKIEITPDHTLDPAESTPKTSVRQQEADNAAAQMATVSREEAAEADADVTSAEPAILPAGPEATEIPAEPSAPPENGSRNDALAALAMERESAAPQHSEPAPALEPLPTVFEPTPLHANLLHDAAPPSLDHQVVVSHHHPAVSGGTWKLIGLATLALLFALLILDILLDAGAISSSAIPHTNFF